MTQFWSILLLVASLYIWDGCAYPAGAPMDACENMIPTGHGVMAQTSPTPYGLTVGTSFVAPGARVTVTVDGFAPGAEIKGILLQARTVDSSSIVGEFLELEDDANFKGLACSGGDNSAVTHISNSGKTLPLIFTWKAPDTPQVVQFRATIVEFKVEFWTNVVSTSVPVSACPESELLDASTCLTTFASDMTDDVIKLFPGELDIITFCRQLEAHHMTFSGCTPEACASLIPQVLELYRNYSAVYCDCTEQTACFVDPCEVAVRPACEEAQTAVCKSNYCGGCWAVWVDGDGDPVVCPGVCELEDVTGLSNCSQVFVEQLEIISEGDNLLPGADLCRFLQEITDRASDCLDNYKLNCGHREEYTSTQTSIDTISQTYIQTYCGGNTGKGCGLLTLSSCFTILSSQPQDTLENCRAYRNLSSCLEEYEEMCGETDLDEIYGEGMTANIDMTLEQCDLVGECPDFQQKLTIIGQCTSDVQPPTVASFDSTCSFLSSVITCMTSENDCELISQYMSSVLSQLRDFLGAFNCDATFRDVAFKPLESECNLESLIDCANPMFEALALPALARSTDLRDYWTLLENVDVDPMGVLDPNLCSAINEGPSATECFITEFLKCSDLFNMAAGQNVSTGMPSAQSGRAMPNISINSLDNPLEPLSPLIAAVDTTSAVLEIRCAEDCNNTPTRLIQFVMCIGPAGFTQNFLEELQETFSSVISKYQNGQDYDTECSTLEVATTCVDNHMAGCPYTEYLVSTLLSTPAFYQVLTFCELQFNFSIPDTSVGCDNEEFVDILRTSVHTTCDTFTLTTQSIENLDTEDICRQLQFGIDCMSSASQCCSIKQQTVLPRFHTLALMNEELSNCDIKVPMEGIKIGPADNCDYLKVLRCYLPLLNIAGIESITSLDQPQLTTILSLKENFTINQCLSPSEMTDIESCVWEKSADCNFPAICDSDQSESMHLPLGDLIGYREISDQCAPACHDLPDGSLFDCVSPTVGVTFGYVGSSDITGKDVEEECQAIRSMMNCVKQVVGECRPQIMKARVQLGINNVGFLRLAEICELDLQFLDDTIATTPRPTIPAIPVTTGAGGLRAEASIFIGAAIALVLSKM